LTTSATVKEAMLHDPGSRDADFIQLVQSIRGQLLDLAGVSQTQGYECVLMQGSGTFGVESVLSSIIPAGGKLLVLVNGAYGQRMITMAARHSIAVVELCCPEDTRPDASALDRALAGDPAITHVAAVHCETTSGIINPVESLGEVVRRHQRTFIVDAMSSFGAVPLDFQKAAIDFLVSSANKCIEGVPGFSFIIARREKLLQARGQARTLSLDLHDQWQGLENNGQFRFTPPTQALLAFAQALKELEAEGGVEGRARRYQANHTLLVQGMSKLGFKTFLPPDHQGYIITSFHYPEDPTFKFEKFYQELSDLGFAIYPGKLTQADCFRIGNIGHLDSSDIRNLLQAIGQVRS
jgi:2-aminoethylphosphonate-pyruvate transaminase